MNRWPVTQLWACDCGSPYGLFGNDLTESVTPRFKRSSPRCLTWLSQYYVGDMESSNSSHRSVFVS